jgi:hypothetical protein
LWIVSDGAFAVLPTPATAGNAVPVKASVMSCSDVNQPRWKGPRVTVKYGVLACS